MYIDTVCCTHDREISLTYIIYNGIHCPMNSVHI